MFLARWSRGRSFRAASSVILAWASQYDGSFSSSYRSARWKHTQRRAMIMWMDMSWSQRFRYVWYWLLVFVGLVFAWADPVQRSEFSEFCRCLHSYSSPLAPLTLQIAFGLDLDKRGGFWIGVKMTNLRLDFQSRSIHAHKEPLQRGKSKKNIPLSKLQKQQKVKQSNPQFT